MSDSHARPTSFGEQGALLTYGSYLRIPELLAQQVPTADPPAHDELLFITIHQVYELWFQLLLAELTDARDTMLAGEWYVPRIRLARCHTIERVLVGQVDVIDTMTPQDFLAFRTRLAPASGFQSAQFREIEFLSGLKDAGFLERFRGLSAADDERLRRRLSEPSLWDAYLVLLDKAGFAVVTVEERLTALREIAHDRERFGRSGTSPKGSWSTTRPGRSGGPAMSSWPSGRSGPRRAPAARPAGRTCARASSTASTPSCGSCAAPSDPRPPGCPLPRCRLPGRCVEPALPRSLPADRCTRLPL